MFLLKYFIEAVLRLKTYYFLMKAPAKKFTAETVKMWFTFFT